MSLEEKRKLLIERELRARQASHQNNLQAYLTKRNATIGRLRKRVRELSASNKQLGGEEAIKTMSKEQAATLRAAAAVTADSMVKHSLMREARELHPPRFLSEAKLRAWIATRPHVACATIITALDNGEFHE